MVKTPANHIRTSSRQYGEDWDTGTLTLELYSQSPGMRSPCTTWKGLGWCPWGTSWRMSLARPGTLQDLCLWIKRSVYSAEEESSHLSLWAGSWHRPWWALSCVSRDHSQQVGWCPFMVCSLTVPLKGLPSDFVPTLQSECVYSVPLLFQLWQTITFPVHSSLPISHSLWQLDMLRPPLPTTLTEVIQSLIT